VPTVTGGGESAASEEAADQASSRGPPKALAAAVRGALADLATTQRLVAAGAAWGVTVAPAAFARTSPWLGVVLAVGALLSGMAGPLLPEVSKRLARHVGVTVFLALSVLTWVMCSTALEAGRIDALRGMFGGVAWGVFALSWSDPWRAARREPEPGVAPLTARSSLPTLAVPITVIGVVAALGCMATAWYVEHPDRALLGQAAAIASAVALITASATVAVARGKRKRWSSRRFTPRAVRSLMLLLLLGLLGAAILLTVR